MTSLPVHLAPATLEAARPGPPPQVVQCGQAMSPAQIERRIARVGLRTLLLMVCGVVIVSFVLGVLLPGWDLALLFTVGTTLFALLFGGPFWIAAYDDIVRAERDRCLDQQPH